MIRRVASATVNSDGGLRRRCYGLILFSRRLTVAYGALWLTFSPAWAQQTIEVTGDRLSGIVLPVEPVAGDIHLESRQAWAWTVDDTKRLLLEGDVHIMIGGYTFTSREAVVWINRIPSAEGLINQIAVFFDEVTDSAKPSGISVQSGPLLVTGSARGDVRLNVSSLKEQQPSRRDILRNAEDHLKTYLERLLADPPRLQSRPQVERLQEKQKDFVPLPDARTPRKGDEAPVRVTLPGVEEPTPWLAGPQGVIRFSADRIEIATGEDENTISIFGSIVVDYLADQTSDELSQLTLTAERAVIFTEPGPLRELAGQLEAEQVHGIYLEGNVRVIAQDGEYIVRAPHVYYDFRTQQAIMVNALLRVQPRDIKRPVYARAQEMRQLAANQWQAHKTVVSTSEFATPHLAIGAEQATITERPPSGEDGDTITHLESRDNTVQVAGLPVFYWPRFSGDVERVPLRTIEVGARDNDGFRVLSTWDLYSLMGREPPDGVEADLHVDGFTKRGAGGGLELRYDVADSEGAVDLYGLYDEGVDRTSSGRNVEPDQEFRGVALLEHQSQLSDHWLLQAQGAYISDETFITAWREDDFAERREYETSLYLKHQRDNAAFTALAKYSLNDFLSNDYLLASRQFSVDKLPELAYRRYGDSLFNDRFTYSTETRASRMQLVFQETTPREIGVPGGAFGLGDDDRIDEALRDAGLHSMFVHRFDTRHELTMPTHVDIFNVTPFVVGRFTAYDDDFESFSSDSDSTRAFSAAGLRINTLFQSVNNNAESRLFDVHRLRHLVEPYATIWYGHSSVGQEHLPEYDVEVESLADGDAVQFGLRNTWQTQRGGPGRWHSVNLFTLDTSIVLGSESEPAESPTPQFFDYRPEYSQFGDHLRAQAIWLISDSLSLAGEGTYTLEDSVLARGSVGMELRHTPLLTTYIEYRHIDISDNQLLGVGWTYQLTPVYQIALRPQWDFRAEEFRSLTVGVTRSFPEFDLTVQVKHDQIRDETTFGASMQVAEF